MRRCVECGGPIYNDRVTVLIDGAAHHPECAVPADCPHVFQPLPRKKKWPRPRQECHRCGLRREAPD